MITSERQAGHHVRPCRADLAFEWPGGTAVHLLHLQRDGVCASCGCGEPCRTVVLAVHNLALVYDTASAPSHLPRPPHEGETSPYPLSQENA
ncbi:hypothetical protein Franean1_2635 [Parafrankia sp. EAN1pec]|nr:hypothetical protein Franean1_2635 [Frankia sp. EAN1pec]